MPACRRPAPRWTSRVAAGRRPTARRGGRASDAAAPQPVLRSGREPEATVVLPRVANRTPCGLPPTKTQTTPTQHPPPTTIHPRQHGASENSRRRRVTTYMQLLCLLLLLPSARAYRATGPPLHHRPAAHGRQLAIMTGPLDESSMAPAWCATAQRSAPAAPLHVCSPLCAAQGFEQRGSRVRGAE